MKEQTKRILSLILALMCCLGLLSTVAGAAENAIPATGTAYAAFQSVEVDGGRVMFRCYALKDEAGNNTNYIRLRDLAFALRGTAVQFAVDWNGSVSIATRTAYTPDGSELSMPFTGDRTYKSSGAATRIDGQAAPLSAFVLTDSNGGGYTYYRLRDLGQALGFNVGWAAERGMFLESDKPYSDAD